MVDDLTSLHDGRQYIAVFQREDGTSRIRYLDALRVNMVEEDRDDDELFIESLIEGMKKTEMTEPGTMSLHVARYEQLWSSEEEESHGR